MKERDFARKEYRRRTYGRDGRQEPGGFSARPYVTAGLLSVFILAGLAIYAAYRETLPPEPSREVSETRPAPSRPVPPPPPSPQPSQPSTAVPSGSPAPAVVEDVPEKKDPYRELREEVREHPDRPPTEAAPAAEAALPRDDPYRKLREEALKRREELRKKRKPHREKPAAAEEKPVKLPPEVIERYVERMSDPDKETRRKAAWDLARSGPEGAARLLAMYTGDGSEESELARHGLWGARKESVPVLMEALRSGTEAQKELALRFLPRFDDTSTRDGLLSYLAENEPEAGIILKVLADGGHAVRVVTILPYTRHPDPEVRTQAARILGRSKRHSYSSRRLKTAPDGDSETGNSYHTLVAMLDDEAGSVRAAAACGIGHHDYATGIDRLIPLLDDPDFSVQACAARSVRLLDSKWHTRLWAKESLGGIISFLGSPGSWSRDFAERNLPRIDPEWQHGPAAERAVARLDIQVRTGTDDERYWAAWGLGKIATPSAGRPLADAILDPNQDVQRHARAGIVNVGRPAVEHLIRNIGEGEEPSRRRTMGALRSITGLSFDRSPKKWNHWWHTGGREIYLSQAKND